MTSHKKNSNNKPTKTATAPLTAQQKEEQEIEHLLQIYAPERRESMREQIRQRKQQRGSAGKRRRND